MASKKLFKFKRKKGFETFPLINNLQIMMPAHGPGSGGLSPYSVTNTNTSWGNTTIQNPSKQSVTYITCNFCKGNLGIVLPPAPHVTEGVSHPKNVEKIIAYCSSHCVEEYEELTTDKKFEETENSNNSSDPK